MFFNFMKNTPLKRDRESAAVSTPDEEKITSAAPTLDALNDNLTITNDELVTDNTNNNNTLDNQMCDKTGQTVTSEANNVKTNSMSELVSYEHQQQQEEPKQQSASSEEILLAEEDENVFNHKMQSCHDTSNKNNYYNKKQEINTSTVAAPTATSARTVPNSAYAPFHGDYSNDSDTPIETHSTECSSHSYSSSSLSSSSYSSASSSSENKSFTSHKTTSSSEKSASHSQNSFYYSDAESNEVCISQMKRKIIQRNRNNQNNYSSNNFIVNNSVMNDDCYYEPHNENMYYNNQNQQLLNSSNDKNKIYSTNQYNSNYNNNNEENGFDIDEENDENEDEDDNNDHNSHNRRQDRKKRYPRFTSEYAERFRHEMVPFLRVLPYFTPCDEILESNCPYNNINKNNNQNGSNATSSFTSQEKQQLQRIPEHEHTQSQKEGDELFTQQHFQSIQSEHELFTPISQPSENTAGLTASSLINTQNTNINKQQEYEDNEQQRQYSRGNKRPRSASPRRHPLVLYSTYLYCRTLGKGTYSKVVLAQRVPPSALAMRDALHYNKLYHGSNNNNNNVNATPNSPFQKQYSEIINKNNNGAVISFQNSTLCNDNNKSNAAVMNPERTSTSYAASRNTFTFSNSNSNNNSNNNNNNSETYNRTSTRSVELNTPGMAALRALHSNVNGIGLGGGDSVGGGVPLVALKVFRDKDAYREACWDEVAVLRALCRPDNHINHHHINNDNDGYSDGELGQYAITAHCPIAGDDGGAALMGYLSHVGRFVGFIEYIPHPVHPAIAFPVMGPSLLHVVRNVKRASKRVQARCRQLGQEYQLRKQTLHDIHNNLYQHHKEEQNNQKKKQEHESIEHCNSCDCGSKNNTHNKVNNNTSEETEHKELLYRGLSTSLLKTVLYQILLFLQYIHARGVVHTDLKPENVLFESRIALPKELPIYSSKQHDYHQSNHKNKYNTTNASSQNQTYSDKHNNNADYNSNKVTSCVPHYTQEIKHDSQNEKLYASQEKQTQLMLSEQKERNNEMKMHSAQAAMKSKPYYDNETDTNKNMNELDNMNKNSPIGQRANKTTNDSHETQIVNVDAEYDEHEQQHPCHYDPMQDVDNADSKRNEQNCKDNNDESSFHIECNRTISHVVRVRLPLLNSVRVTDLGTAQFLANFTHRSHIDGVTLVSYDVIQTSHYRAPEVIMGVGWSRSADLFSLGCMIPELLTGECLFMPKDTLEHLALMEHIIGPFQPPPRLHAKYFQQSHYVHDHPEQRNDNNENKGKNVNNTGECNAQTNMTRHISLDEFDNKQRKANYNNDMDNNDANDTSNMEEDKYGNDNILREVFAINGATYSHYFNLRTNKLRWPLSERMLSEFHEEKRQEREMRRLARRRERVKQMHANEQHRQQREKQHQQYKYNYNEEEEDENYDDDDDEDDEEEDELIQPLSVTRSKDYKFVKDKPTLREILGFDKELLDLTRRLLSYHPLKRITADEALRHPYFSAM